MTTYRTQAPEPTQQGTKSWVLMAGVAAVAFGSACAVLAATSAPAQTSLYANVAQTTATRAAVSAQVGIQRPASAAVHYASAAPAGEYVPQVEQVEFMQTEQSQSTIAAPMGVGAALLLVAGVVYNFFNKPQYKPLAVPAPLQSVVAQAARSVRLNTRSVDQHTTLALMTMTSSKASKGFKSPVFSEQCDQTGITLSRYMLEVARANPDMIELESVFSSIQTACKTISKLVKRSAIDGMTGYAGGGGSINVQGEEQKKLDVITNDVLKKALKFTGRMGVIASEEEDTPVAMDNSLDESYGKDVLVEEGGKYVSVFDPLDGSSNIDAGIPVGTIFGIYEEDGDCVLPDDYFEGGNNLADAMKDCLKSTLKPGNSLVSSGYCLYSSATHFVFTLGDGVQGFTLDDSIGEFILTHPNITVPPRGKIYSINEANRPQWDGPMTKWIDGLAAGTNKSGVAYSSRYIGSMVGDVHRTLLYGGVFAYPGDSKNPNGKLRLLYEVAPMSFLIEQAGGAATTGMARCMDLPPKDVHQRVPLIMGGKDEISELEEIYKNEAPEELKEAQLARLKY